MPKNQAEDRKPLTAKALEAIKPDGSRQEIPDPGCRGLYHFVLPSGLRSWYYRYRNATGKQQRLPLGSYPDVGLAEARRKADAFRKIVIDGGDPASDKKRTREIEAAKKEQTERTAARGDAKKLTRENTFAAVWAEFDRSHMVAEFRPGTIAKWRSIYARHFAPRWRSRPLHEVDSLDIAAMLRTLRNTPHAATTARVVIRAFFLWCVEEEILDASPAEDTRPKRKRKRRAKEREAEDDSTGRALSDAEIRALWFATEGNPQFGNVVRLLLLTGTRRNEVARATWDEFNEAAAIWKIPGARTKNGLTHTVFLSSQALAVIGDIPKLDGSPFLFPTHKGTTPVSGFSKHKVALDRAMAEAAGRAIEPWRLHDLRKTFATGLARLTITQTVCARCLNHTSEGKQTPLDRIYNKHDYEAETLTAWQAWGQHVARLVAIDSPNIVPFRGEAVPTVPA